MIYIQDSVAKLGGIILQGLVTAIEIGKEAIIDEVKDDNGNLKSVQPLGYEAGKVTITMEFEDQADKTTLEQIEDLERLFHPYGGEKPTLLNIVNDDCAARGIDNVYFKVLTTKTITVQSKRTATLELITPSVTKIQVTKKSTSSSANSSATSSTAVSAAIRSAGAAILVNRIYMPTGNATIDFPEVASFENTMAVRATQNVMSTKDILKSPTLDNGTITSIAMNKVLKRLNQEN